MNMNRLINMGVRMLLRKGMNKGVEVVSNRGNRPEDMTSEQRAQAKSTQQTVQKARKGIRAARRFMR